MMKKRIGSVSINPKARDHNGIPFEAFYDSFGKNTGNYMFTQAMYRQLAGKVSHAGFSYNPEEANENFDHIVIPAANWLNPGANWDWLTDIIERTEIPVTIIGIGLQAETTDLAKVKVSDSAIRFIKTAAKKSPLVSTRGDFTRDWLHSIGVDNAVTTGCPSLYMRLNIPDKLPVERAGFVLQSTRYAMNKEFLNSTGVNRALFRLAGQTDSWMIYQSEPEELQYLATGQIGHGKEPVFEDLMPELYAKADRATFVDYLERRGKVFFDLDEWAKFLQGTNGVIGTRLHGSILALNAGVPALMIAHDSRTSEMASFAGIPILNDLTALTSSQAVQRLLDVDIKGYQERRTLNSEKYKSFLAICGLDTNPEYTF